MFRRTLTLLSEASRNSASASSSSSDILTSHLSKTHLPPSLARSQKPHKNLYQLLSSLPNDGVGAKVRQRRWAAKGLDVPHEVDLKQHLAQVHANGGMKKQDGEGHLCYWEITKVRLKDGGKHGKAWGRLVWRGKYCLYSDEIGQQGECTDESCSFCFVRTAMLQVNQSRRRSRQANVFPVLLSTSGTLRSRMKLPQENKRLSISED